MIETAASIDPLTYAAFWAAAVALYLAPGTDMMFAIACGVAGGPKAGAAAACGIALGVLCHGLLAAAGLAALVSAYPAAYHAIRLMGAAYLLWLAYQAWAAGAAIPSDGRADLWRAFRRGFATNMMNPKVALFALAFLPQFADPAVGPLPLQIAIFAVLLALGGVVAKLVYGVLAGALAARIHRASGVLNKITAIVFGGLAARLVID